MRSVLEIRRLFTYNPSRAAILRGTPVQMAAAEWIFGGLRPRAERDYAMPGSDDVIRVLQVPNAPTVQDFQEVATTIRAIGEIRRLFTYNDTRMIIARGTRDQMRLADWIVAEMARKSGSEFRFRGDAEGVVRMFFLTKTGTVQDFQQAAAAVRTTTAVRRAFTCNRPRALTLRGTDDQIAAAESLIRQMDR